MRPVVYVHGATRLVLDPHVEMAIWAIIAAVVCVLVTVIGERVKSRNAALQSHRDRPKKPDRRR